MTQVINKFINKNSFNATFFAAITAFFTYMCFYPFRRAYTAATYEELSFLGVNFKILMITAQVLGFAVSKGLGIKYVSEMLPENLDSIDHVAEFIRRKKKWANSVVQVFLQP